MKPLLGQFTRYYAMQVNVHTVLDVVERLGDSMEGDIRQLAAQQLQMRAQMAELSPRSAQVCAAPLQSKLFVMR